MGTSKVVVGSLVVGAVSTAAVAIGAVVVRIGSMTTFGSPGGMSVGAVRIGMSSSVATLSVVPSGTLGFVAPLSVVLSGTGSLTMALTTSSRS